MAFDESFNPDEENQQAQGQGSAAKSLAPTGGVISSGPSGQGGAPSTPNTQTSSGSFTNLQNYLTANADQNFGSQLAGKVQGEVDQANQAQTGADQAFRSQVDKNTVNPDQNLVNSAVSDPASFVKDPNNVAQWNQQLNAQYQGPSSFSSDANDYNHAYQATQNAQQAANATQSEGGRFALLNQFFGNQPNYTQGQQNLDQFLVQADPSAQAAFQGASKAANNTSQKWNTLNAADTAYAQNAQNQTQTAAQNAANAGNSALNAENSAIQNGLSQDQTLAQKGYANDQSTFGGDNSQWASLLSALGASTPAAINDSLAGGTDTGYWGVSPNTYLSAENPTLSSATALSDQQKLNALQTLMGQPVTSFDATQAGSFNPNKPVGFDASGFNNAIAAKQTQYQSQEQGIQSALNQILARPVPAGTPGPPTAANAYSKDIQGQIDQLNTIRASYGLPAISNPYGANYQAPPISGAGGYNGPVF